MPLYKVIITSDMVIEAEDEESAASEVNYYARDAVDMLTHTWPEEIKSLEDLPGDWDKECLPYNGDGMTRLIKLLPTSEGESK